MGLGAAEDSCDFFDGQDVWIALGDCYVLHVSLILYAVRLLSRDADRWPQLSAFLGRLDRIKLIEGCDTAFWGRNDSLRGA